MEIKKYFGKRIKELRLKHELTQEQFAERIGITSKGLSQIELGKNFVSAEVLNSICETMNVKPKSLFDFEYYDKDKTNLIEDVVNKISNDSSILQLVHKIIGALES